MEDPLANHQCLVTQPPRPSGWKTHWPITNALSPNRLARPVGWEEGEAIGDDAIRLANVLADCFAPTIESIL